MSEHEQSSQLINIINRFKSNHITAELTQNLKILKDKLDTYVDRLAQFKNLIAAKEKEKQDARDEQVVILNKEIESTKEKMSEIIGKVDVENLVLKETPASEALDTLKKQKKMFDLQRAKMETYNDYQATLSEQVQAAKEIEMFDKKWNNRNKLWENVSTFNLDYSHWMDKPFVQEVDANEVEKKVKGYLIACNDVKTTFPKGTKDEVLDTLSL